MALFSLLSVSPTLRLASDMPRRYRAQKGQGLPKFGADPAKVTQKKAMKVDVRKDPEQSAPQTTTPPRAQAPWQAPRPVMGGGARQGPAWWNLKAWLVDRWFGQQNRFAAAPPRAARLPVQQELSLENLKPCRNDLSDAGWELAPSPAARQGKAVLKQQAAGAEAAPEVCVGGRREAVPTRI